MTDAELVARLQQMMQVSHRPISCYHHTTADGLPAAIAVHEDLWPDDWRRMVTEACRRLMAGNKGRVLDPNRVTDL